MSDSGKTVLRQDLLAMHVFLSIHMDNWRCVSVCLKLLGVLCVFPPHFVTFASGYC